MDDALALPSELTIYTIGEWYPRSLEWLRPTASAVEASTALRLEGSAVADVDGAGVQWLIALSNSLARQDRRLALINPSVPLAGVCTGLGVAHLLEPTTSRETTP